MAFAQSPVALTIDTRSPGYAVPTNFTGLSMSAHNFLDLETNADAQMVTLFQNIGLHSLRLGFGASVSNPDIDALFAFQRAITNLQVIFELPFSDIPDTVSAAQYIWTNYQSQFYAFELANEPDKSADWTSYASFFTQWTNFAMAVTSAVPGAVFEGPDPAGQTWGAEFANDLEGSALLVLISQHWYVGGNPNKYDTNSTAQLQIDNMLSNAWVNSLYPSTYNNALVPAQAAGFPFRFTEADDCVGGVTNASNAFAAALWALDFLHWWAANGCAGVDFMNTAWIPTDTIYPDANGNCQINPKAYGIKAFNAGATGSEEPVLMSNPDGLNLTAYAIGLGTNLYVTVINKEHNTGARDASVTITPNGFLSGGVAAMYLTAPNGNVGATNGVTFGGAIITNNAPWLGQWTPLNPLVNGQCTVTVAAASAAVIHIQASVLINPVVLESWTVGSDDYTNDADWMPPLAFSTNGPNNNDDTGNSYTVVITNGGTCYYNGAFGDPVWTNTIGQLWLGGVADGVGGGMSNIFFMSGGSLTLADAGPSDFSIGGNTPGIGVIPSTNFFIMTGGTLNAMASTATNWIAAAPGSVATVDFDGGAANLVTLGIGGRGNATVNINGGNVNVGGDNNYICGIGLGVGAGEGAGTLNLISGVLTATNRSGRAVILGNNCANNILNASGGTLNASGIQFGFGTSSSSVTNTLIVSGGIINISGAGIGRNGARDINNTFLSGGSFSTLATPLNSSPSWDWSGLIPIILTNSPGAGLVTFAPLAGASIQIDAAMSGNGGINVAGPGAVILTATSSFTGNTIVSGGTLSLVSGATIADCANIIVASNATFDVSGLLSPLTLGSIQTLSNSSSTAVLSGSLAIGSGTLSLMYAGAPSFTIVTNGILTLSSSTVLKVNNTGSPLAAGNYLLVSTNGADNSAVGGTVPPVTVTGGVAADTTSSLSISNNELYLAVTGGINPNPANLVFSVSGNQLTLSWPKNHTGWQLQTQTNRVSVGISTNWANMSGTTGTNQVVIPVNLTDGAVFYRLMYHPQNN